MTKPRVRAILLSLLVVLTLSFLATAARAQSASPNPTASATTTPEARAGNAIVGLIILTAFAAAGSFVAKWIRRDRGSRPPGQGGAGSGTASSRF